MAVNHRCYEVSISSELMHSARKPNSKKTKHRQATGCRQVQPESPVESESEPDSEIDDTLDDWHSSDRRGVLDRTLCDCNISQESQVDMGTATAVADDFPAHRSIMCD